MTKNIGIIGVTGRMGSLLADLIKSHSYYSLGPCFSKSLKPYIELDSLFKDNDYIIDFSSASLTQIILKLAVLNPKPLIICTTGWSTKELDEPLKILAEMVPVVITSNTSIGASIQRYLARQLAKILDAEYDIDVLEKHHRNKVDRPSGTAKSLIDDIKKEKQLNYSSIYKSDEYIEGKRPENFIGTAIQRSGNLPGEHEVIFTSLEESLSIKHIIFNRDTFAKGALKIIDWIESTDPAPGIYDMLDVLNLKS